MAQMEFERRNYSVAVITRLASRPASAITGAVAHKVGYAGLSIDASKSTEKIRRPSSGGGKFRGDFSFGRSLLPHIDLCWPRHLAVSNGRLPDSVSRITPDASNI